MSREAAMGMGGKSRGGTSSGNTGGNGGGNRESYGGGGQYSAPSAPPAPSGNGGVDPGFQEALRQQAIRQADPVFGDPDPQVDIDPRERDSITSFLDNYAANVKANPLMAGTIGALTTLYQTEQAKNMLLDTPGYEFLNDYSIPSDGNIGRDESSQQIVTKLVSQLPYTLTNSTPQKSMVNDYFANANLGLQLSSDLQTRYNNAKTNLNNILNIKSVEDQFGYVGQPNLLNLNLTGLI